MSISKINEPSIAVLLNAWAELDQPIQQQCFEKTLQLIDSQPSISTVLLACTHVDMTQQNQGPNHWYDNAKTIFLDEQGVDWIRRYWQMPKKPGFATHNPLLRDHDYQGKLCLAIWEQWELEYLLNHCLTKENNIWFFGSGHGVRRDPVGWGQFCDLVRHRHVRPMNILTHRQGMTINTMSGHSYADSVFCWPPWEHTDWHELCDDIMIKTTLDWQIPPWGPHE